MYTFFKNQLLNNHLESSDLMGIYAPIQVFVSKKNLEITEQVGGVSIIIFF